MVYCQPKNDNHYNIRSRRAPSNNKYSSTVILKEFVTETAIRNHNKCTRVLISLSLWSPSSNCSRSDIFLFQLTIKSSLCEHLIFFSRFYGVNFYNTGYLWRNQIAAYKYELSNSKYLSFAGFFLLCTPYRNLIFFSGYSRGCCIAAF